MAGLKHQKIGVCSFQTSNLKTQTTVPAEVKITRNIQTMRKTSIYKKRKTIFAKDKLQDEKMNENDNEVRTYIKQRDNTDQCTIPRKIAEKNYNLFGASTNLN